MGFNFESSNMGFLVGATILEVYGSGERQLETVINRNQLSHVKFIPDA